MGNSNRDFFKRLFLGENWHFNTYATSKRAILTSQLSLFCIIISLFYIVFDYLHGSYSLFLIYGLFATSGISALILIRFGYYHLAKLLLIVSASLVVFLIIEMENHVAGSNIFFICCILGSFALFGHEDRRTALILSIFIILLSLLTFKVDLSFLPKSDFPKESEQDIYMIDFTVASITVIIITLFLLNQHALSQNDLKKTTDELLLSKQQFELAIQGSSAGIWDWNIQKDELFISPLIMTMLEYPDEKFLNLNSERLFRILHPDDLASFKQQLEAHFKNRIPFSVECRLRKADGEYIWVLETGQALWDDKGQPVRMVGTILDVNDRHNAFKKVKEQNELLEKTNEELDRFVYSTSHDLRAPLSSILGLINVAELNSDPQVLKECLERMKKSIHTLNGFIAEIIDYSRNSRLGISTEEVKLNVLITEVIEGLKYYQQSQQIDIQVKVPKNISIQTDRGRLKIILNNLIANAIKYHNINQPNPFIIINWELRSETGIISIEDNGTGIPHEYQAKIFNMFYRASEDSEGSGLGLYIAKEMVEKLNGYISVNSALEKGTTFYVNLPLQEVMQPANA